MQQATAGQMNGTLDRTNRLDIKEWAFDRIPRDELFICLLYEYSRESESIQSWLRRMREFAFTHGGRYWENADGTRSQMKPGQDQREIWRELSKCQPKQLRPFRQIEFQNMLLACGTQGTIRPWQRLPTESRERFRVLVPIDSPVRRGWPLDLKRIEEALKDQRGLPLGRPWYCDPEGWEATVLVIDWQHFDNAQIQSYLGKWVRDNRPNQFSEVKRSEPGKQKLSDLRAQLKALGAMRVLSHYRTIERTKSIDPAAWDFFGGERKGGAGKELRRLRNACFRYFTQLFPFESRKPRSALSHDWKEYRTRQS